MTVFRQTFSHVNKGDDLVNSHLVTHEAAQAKMQDPENFNRLVHRTAPDGASTAFADGFGGSR